MGFLWSNGKSGFSRSANNESDGWTNYEDLSNTREVPSFLTEMVENEQLGIRTNQGFYKYDDHGEKAIYTRDDHFLDLLKLK